MNAPQRKSRRLLVWTLLLVVLGLGGWSFWKRERVPTTELSSDASASTGSFARRSMEGRASETPSVSAAWEQPTATISGTVRAEEGGPIAGAQVCAEARGASLPTQLQATPRCTTTDARGAYRLTHVLPVRNAIRASAARRRPAVYEDAAGRAEIRPMPGRDLVGIDLTLASGGAEARGIVRDLAGGVIEGAWVRIASRDAPGPWTKHPVAFGRTDAEGRFSIWTVPGEQFVVARIEGYSDAMQLGVAPGYFFELFLTPASTISGRVVRADTREPVSGATVSPDASFFSFGWGRSATTDSEGRFRLEGLEPGRYHPRASSESGHGRSSAAVLVGLAQDAEHVVIELHPAVTVRGTVVVGPDERPCPTGRVRLEREGDDQQSTAEIEAEGQVELHGVLPGRYEVTINCQDRAESGELPPLDVASEPPPSQRWHLTDRSILRGTVIDDERRPVAGATVRATAREVEGEARSGGTVTDAQGAFELPGLDPGVYEVRASAPGFSEPKEPVEITLSETDPTSPVELVLTPGGVVEGVVRSETSDPVSGVTVSVKGDHWSARAQTDDEGHFEIDGVRPGRHRILAQKDWGDPLRAPGTTDDELQGRSVDVRDGERSFVELVVESRSGLLRGRVLDDTGGPVADAFIDVQRESDSQAAAAGSSLSRIRWGGFFDAPVLTDTDGSFEVEGLAPGDYTIRAHRRGGGEGLLEHVPVDTSGLELRIDETGSVSGRVRVTGNGAPEQFSVTLSDEARGFRLSDDFYRTSGVFILEGIPAGSYRLVVDTPRGDATDEFELSSGEHLENLELELTHRVSARGRILDLESGEPVPDMRVTISPKGGSWSWSDAKHGDPNVSDDTGRFEVERAPVGRVTVMVSPRSFNDESYGWAHFERVIEASGDRVDLGDIEVVPTRLDRSDARGDLGFEVAEVPPDVDEADFPLKVAVVRPGGPAEQAGLEIGARIESVDGHDVTGSNRYRYSALTRVRPGRQVELGLEGDRSVTIRAGDVP